MKVVFQPARTPHNLPHRLRVLRGAWACRGMMRPGANCSRWSEIRGWLARTSNFVGLRPRVCTGKPASPDPAWPCPPSPPVCRASIRGRSSMNSSDWRTRSSPQDWLQPIGVGGRAAVLGASGRTRPVTTDDRCALGTGHPRASASLAAVERPLLRCAIGRTRPIAGIRLPRLTAPKQSLAGAVAAQAPESPSAA